eukprot:g47044.t1
MAEEFLTADVCQLGNGENCSTLYSVESNELLSENEEDSEHTCETLLMCIITVLSHGLRSGGGVGDVLRKPSKEEPLFAARVIYDLLFFFMVIIIVLNLIFGVIIDTFADLRSEKQKKEEVLKTTCFICGDKVGLVDEVPKGRRSQPCGILLLQYVGNQGQCSSLHDDYVCKKCVESQLLIGCMEQLEPRTDSLEHPIVVVGDFNFLYIELHLLSAKGG